MAVPLPESYQSMDLSRIPSGSHMPSLEELDARAAEGQEIIGLNDALARAAYQNRYEMRAALQDGRSTSGYVSPELGTHVQRLKDRRSGQHHSGEKYVPPKLGTGAQQILQRRRGRREESRN